MHNTWSFCLGPKVIQKYILNTLFVISPLNKNYFRTWLGMYMYCDGLLMHKDGKNSARELEKIGVKTILSDCESGSKLPTDKLSNESQGSIIVYYDYFDKLYSQVRGHPESTEIMTKLTTWFKTFLTDRKTFCEGSFMRLMMARWILTLHVDGKWCHWFYKGLIIQTNNE